MKIGKIFMFGFSGYEPTKEILDFIREDGLGGVILFRRNIKSVEQLKRLTGELKSAAGGNFLIGIDQEGGRVSKLPASILDIPPMENLGRDFVNGEGVNKAHNLGHELGDVLTSLGINLDFAPVLDVNTNPKNPIIGNRALSSNPDVVSKLGCEVFRGMVQGRIIPCGKHFPGHGDTSEDSHKALPKVSHDMRRLNEVELKPFAAAIENGIPSLMSAHVVYEGVDAENPATLSKRILTGILRESLGFDGVLFSDDLEMDAIAKNYDMRDAAVRSVNAGCDILLVCHTLAYQKMVIGAVREAVDSGKISAERISEAQKRIKNLHGIIS